MAKVSTGLVAGALLVILAVFVQSGAALKCWSCNSLQSGTCGEDFNPSKLTDVERNHFLQDCLIPPLNIRKLNITARPVCKKLVTEVAGVRTYSRSCFYESDKFPVGECPKRDEKYFSVEFCESCDSDECNSGSYLMPLVALVVLPILAIFRQ